MDRYVYKRVDPYLVLAVPLYLQILKHRPSSGYPPNIVTSNQVNLRFFREGIYSSRGKSQSVVIASCSEPTHYCRVLDNDCHHFSINQEADWRNLPESFTSPGGVTSDVRIYAMLEGAAFSTGAFWKAGSGPRSMTHMIR
ncbi:hypothetical protein AFLA_001970 [Aspergillus flavus NRRL3357]|nr:hypothetical protein AFLA_001970 [Aspergillus flavus NRRL3357]